MGYRWAGSHQNQDEEVEGTQGPEQQRLDEEVEEEEEDEDEEVEEEEEREETQESEGFLSIARKRSALWFDSEGTEESPRKRSFASAPKTTSSSIAADGREMLLMDDEPTSSSHWIEKALTSIHEADCYIMNRESRAPPFPMLYLPRLQKLRFAAFALSSHTDDAISRTQMRQALLKQKACKEKLAAARRELKQLQLRYYVQVGLVQEARADAEKQKDLFQKEKEAQDMRHKCEKLALQRQLDEEKNKSICCVCQDKPRDTIIIPCLHFQYCFSCILAHREVNSNTCPTCRGPIQGLSMSSYLASQ